VGDPIIVSDGSSGDRLPKEVHIAGEEVKAPPVVERAPWPSRLCSVEERRKKEEEEHERGSQQQPQEGQQQPQREGEKGEEGWRQQGERLEELLEQHRQQVLPELQRQRQQESHPLEELLEPPTRSPPQPVPLSPQRPETGEEGLPVYGAPTTVWLCLGGPASIPAEPGQAYGVVAIACAMRTPADPQSEIKGSHYGMDGLSPLFL
jgi:hypothetical protein